MPMSLEPVVARLWFGTHQSTGVRGRGSSLQAGVWRAMNHMLIRFVVCTAWVFAIALIVAWATGCALEL